MTTTLLARAAASKIDTSDGLLPLDVQWMPPGRQRVQPMGFDEPFEMHVTPQLALQANAQLQELRRAAAAGRDVEPYFDFNHKDEGRAFIPTNFYWAGDDPKAGGIRAEGTWTGAGTKAVLDGELCCVSASWVLNKLTKAFIGIKHNLGGLVPRSAFHAVQAFAKASDDGIERIADFDIVAATRQLNKKYDLDIPLTAFRDGVHPLLAAATELAARNGTPMPMEATKLSLLEPDLARHWNYSQTGADSEAMRALQEEIKRLQGNPEEFVKTKAGAEFMYKTARANQKQNGVSFEEGWTMARNTIFQVNTPHDQQLANAIYTKAMEHKRAGLPFDQAWAKASTEVTVTAKARLGSRTAQLFVANASAFAAEHGLSELDGQIAYARTPAGAEIYRMIEGR